MTAPRTRKQLQLHTAHDNKSLVGICEASPNLDCLRFSYAIEGSPVPHHIDLPRRLFSPTLIPGVRTIVSIAITQVEAQMVDVPEEPIQGLTGLIGVNGKKL